MRNAMSSYYNEIDTHCCRVLFQHIGGDTLPIGMLDAERSIKDVTLDDVRGYKECHFFAGIGGFPLGFKKAGLSGVNVWTGGFPCQDLSVAGNRAGLAGERSGLWFEFYRLLAAARPHWVVIENVPGLLSSNGGRDFAVILRGLVKLGYGVAWRILDAQYFGVPQRRRRVFIVGHLGDGRASQVLFESESGAWDPPPSREAGARSPSYAVRRAQTSSNGWGIQRDVTHTLDGTGGDVVAYGGNNTKGQINVATACNAHGSRRYDFESETFIAFDRTRGTSSGDISAPLRACGGRSEGVNDAKADAQCVALYHENKGSSLTERDTAVALREGASHSYQFLNEQCGVRRLTPTECERLQGFPDGWTAGQSDTQRYKQLGNAVAVPVIEWLGRRIGVVR